MKVFITDLAAYNQGVLVGKWITLPLSDFEIAQAISEVLTEGEHITATDNHEELFITDWECDIDGIIHEYGDIYTLNEIAEEIERLSDTDKKKIKYLMEYHLCKFDEALERCEDVEMYEDTTMTELAEMFVEEGLFGNIPDAVLNYIDYEAIARDLSMDYDEVGDNVYRVV